MIKTLFFLWVVSSTGIPTMNTLLSYDEVSCHEEIRRLELEYYRDRLQHRPDIHGETYYLECLTHKEVIERLNDLSLENTF